MVFEKHTFTFQRASSSFPVSTAEWRPGSTGQILSDLDLTSQMEGRWKRINTLAHYNVSTGKIHRLDEAHLNEDGDLMLEKGGKWMHVGV